MYTEARKISLIEEVLKINDDTKLTELEAIIKKPKRRKEKKNSFKEFKGIWTKTEAEQVERVIEETCESINPDDWK